MEFLTFDCYEYLKERRSGLFSHVCKRMEVNQCLAYCIGLSLRGGFGLIWTSSGWLGHSLAGPKAGPSVREWLGAFGLKAASKPCRGSSLKLGRSGHELRPDARSILKGA